MIRWLQALHGGKVLSPKSYTEMITPSKLNDGTPLRNSELRFDTGGDHFILKRQ